MRKLLFALLFFFGFSISRASELNKLSVSNSEIANLWAQFSFSGTPFYADDILALDRIIQDSRQCDLPAKTLTSVKDQIHSLLRKYQLRAKKDDSTQADKIYKNLQKIINSYRGSACYDLVLAHYALGSLSITLFPTIDEKGPDFLYQNSLSLNKQYVLNMGYTTVALFNRGAIRWLTDDQRRQLPGKGWLATNKEGAYKILGAYRCHDSTIYIDPSLRPFNLGAVMVHELDHLFRDKFFKYDPTLLDIENYILIDETLASVHGAYIQRNMSVAEGYAFRKGRKVNSWWNRATSQFDTLVEPRMPKTLPFDINLDVTQYSKNGSVDQLWGLFNYVQSFAGRMDFDSFVRRIFLTKSLKHDDHTRQYFNPNKNFPNNWQYQKLSDFDSSVANPIRAIYNLVSQVYFDHDLLDQQWQSLQPEKLDTELSPLSHLPTEEFPNFIEPVPMGDRLLFLLRRINGLVQQMTMPSGSCKEFEAQSCHLPNYIGYQLNGSCSVKPEGGEGSKPSGPVNPGGEGVKGDYSIRPCLLLDKAL